MSEQERKSKNIFAYHPTTEGCCEVFMASKDTEEVIEFPSEIDGLRVTAIAQDACQSCRNVKTLIIPEGVTFVDMQAFGDCKSLEHLHIPSTLEEFDLYPFGYAPTVSLITCPKGKRPPCSLDDLGLPTGSTLTLLGSGAGEEEDGTVGLYTVIPTCPDDCEVLYSKNLTLTVKRYPKAEAEAYLAEAREYTLIKKKTRTYDVYSSDGVSNDDRDETSQELPFDMKNLAVCDGKCCGVVYASNPFKGLLFFDGTKAGKTAVHDRTLCYGHPLDYYINTSHTLTLAKK